MNLGVLEGAYQLNPYSKEAYSLNPYFRRRSLDPYFKEGLVIKVLMLLYGGSI